jgi:hypothetical protein
MSQSLANIIVHLVFSTKGRRQLLREQERGQPHACMAGFQLWATIGELVLADLNAIDNWQSGLIYGPADRSNQIAGQKS